MSLSTGSRLGAIREKVEAGARLSFEDGLALEASNDLFAIGSMANLVRERLQRQLRLLQRQHPHQPDQRLRLQVRLLRLPRRPRTTSGPMSWTRPRSSSGPSRPTTGGRRSCTSSAACTTSCRSTITSTSIRWIKDDYPEIHIKAYTGRRDRVLLENRPALDPRGLAEAGRRRPGQPAGRRGGDLPPRGPRGGLRGQGLDRDPGSTSTGRPHQLGLHSNATMLYGHIDKAKHRIDHLVRLRELQDETGGLPDLHPPGLPPRQLAGWTRSPSPPA